MNAGKEHPMLFGGPMVLSILNGRKTQTRRLIKPQPRLVGDGVPYGGTELVGLGKCPYKAGDRLWVREKWAVHKYYDGRPKNGCGPVPEGIAVECFTCPDSIRVLPSLTHRSIGEERGKWRPSIHMPRWASRITLEVTEVRCEQLQAITERDAIAEGVEPVLHIYNGGSRREWRDYSGGGMVAEPVFSFRSLWDSINGICTKNSWEANPWVWVIEFKVIAGVA